MNPFEGYRVTSPFGWRKSPISGKQEFHTGIDLVKYHKAPIYAFCDGDVIHAKEGVTGSGFGGYGITVAIRCPQTGHLHCYAHLDSVLVKVGQSVRKGQLIGNQGNTGQSTGSHLHYEIRKTSSPSFGWIADRENNCFEPTKYLSDLHKKQEEEVLIQELKRKVEDQRNIIDSISTVLEVQNERLDKLEGRQMMEVPSWAREAVNAAVDAGIVDTPNGGSYDFYRVLTVLYRMGKI